MTSSIPREVNGVWYPVPCPEGVPLALGFPTDLVCLAFCEAIDPMRDAWESEWAKRQDEMFDEMNKVEEQAEMAGRDAGWVEHANQGCEDADCVCFERGVEYAQAQSETKPA